MIGRFLLSLIAASAITAGVLWYIGYLPPAAPDGAAPGATAKAGPTPSATPRVAKQLGTPLVAQVVQGQPQPTPVEANRATGTVAEPVVIPACRLGLIRRQDVPSPREGVLKFIGKALKPGEQAPPGESTVEYKGQKYRRLRVGDVVEKEELLALVDDALAQAELKIKTAKVKAAKADKIASERTRDEAKKRWETLERLRATNFAVSVEELRGAELTYYRYVYEAESKVEAIHVAEEEENQARKTLDMYEIKTSIPGEVKAIFKRDGEAVKSFEPVLQIQNYEKLQAEGLVDSQYAYDLRKGDEVVIEPTRRERPWRILKGHGQEVTSLAVSKGPDKPVIVSGSEDSTVRIWDPWAHKELQVLHHPLPVRAVACTPIGSEKVLPRGEDNLCLSGCADGKARLWNLNNPGDTPLRVLDGQQRGAITAVAFSPDGELCACASEDGEIVLWTTATGSLRYHIAGAHRSLVSSIQFFTDQDRHLHLVSFSRDNTVKVWKLGTEAAVLVGNPIPRRTTDVPELGISPDGKEFLDPRGSEMRIQSLPGNRTEAVFQNPSQASLFKSFALFSPDGKLVLTTSSSEGILQLWKLGKNRSFELRQLYPADRYPATCAAFDPHSRFVVGGARDRRIYIWPMPSAEEVNQELRGTVTSVGQELVSTENQVPVVAEFDNPQGRRLFAGDVVTIVAYPTK
jgi:WD40 repeat protein